jgi:hypothetical protein
VKDGLETALTGVLLLLLLLLLFVVLQLYPER